MTIRKSVHSDAAAFVYIRSCLMGRAYRFRRKQFQKAQREPAILNEPLRQNEDSIDKLDLVAASDPHFDPNRVTELVTLRTAMQGLTPNEQRVIAALYFKGEKVVGLCNTLQISKNSVLKTKRRALKKLRISLQKSYPASQEERE